MQKFNIKLNIAGKSYALSIEREKEAIFRRAEKEVNRLTAAVESQYMAEREDYLAVVALQLAVRAVELESSRSLGKDIDRLDELDRMLEDHLNKLK
ncbi:MAG TPA: cell division protein ZapA [Candidatus Tidjanibacter faecipullorum]|uniref:Cell division protein ZapA n=1 Tax=Candidatus Tidjanibacter faecipullorum TaxID=2838766 RepID=A0A9D2DCN2_9BACT|nr:cell division protein ZapA [Candidatus Tidjanibacter faecipullorum]